MIRQLVVLFAIISVDSGLEWSATLPDYAVVNTCVGAHIDLPWNFTLAHAERIEDIQWIFQANGRADEVIAMWAAGHFVALPAFSGRVTWTGDGAGVIITGVTRLESGNYSVVINTGDRAHPITSYSRVAHVLVAEPPQTVDGSLHVSQSPHAVLDSATGQWAAQLTCSHFVSLGQPPVDVVWTSPDGHEMQSSSGPDNGTFFFLLPNPPAGGNYSCSLPPSSPARQCLAAHSPMGKGASLLVDQVRASFAVLEVQFASTMKQLQTDLQMTNQRLNQQLNSTNQELQATKDQLQTTNQQLNSTNEQLQTTNHQLQTTQQEVVNLRDENKELLNITAALQAERCNCTKDTMSREIAFQARLTSDFNGHMGAITPWTVLTNIGNSFSGSSGVFTCAIPGIYFFVGSAGTASSGLLVFMSLRKNDAILSQTYAQQYSSYYTTGSVHATVHLDAGDRVYINSDYPSSYYYYLSTTFTGFLVYADN